jgi:uncharacterized membrane protein
MDEMMLVAEMGHGTRTWRNESKAMTRAMERTTVALMVMVIVMMLKVTVTMSVSAIQRLSQVTLMSMMAIVTAIRKMVMLTVVP